MYSTLLRLKLIVQFCKIYFFIYTILGCNADDAATEKYNSTLSPSYAILYL